MYKTNQKKIYPLTYILIGFNLISFALEIKLGGSESLSVLDYLGALIPEKVVAGEWWRLLSANFLHFGWLHLGTNMLALYFLGRLIEVSLGLFKYLLVYFCSGIGAMFFFTIFTLKTGQHNIVLIGASAAIMGLIGSILAIFLQVWLRKRTKLNAKRLRTIILLIVVQFVFDNLVPEVSFTAHLFGLIIGFIISIFLVTLPIVNERVSSP